VWLRVKFGKRMQVEHRGVIYQTNWKRVLYNAGYLLGEYQLT